MSDEKKVEVKTETKPKEKLNIKRIIITAILLIAVISGIKYIYEQSKYQSTDDAYIDTTTVSVAPKVSGEIVAVYVKDNQQVHQGDIIAKIDSRDYQVNLEQAQAAYKKEIVRQTNSKATLEATNSQLALAKRDLDRYTSLYSAGAVSKQILDNAQTKYDSLKSQQIQNQQDILSKSGVKVADANLDVLRAQKDAAALSYSYTNIYAPQDGTVSSKRVEKGMMVQAGSPLFTLVPNKVRMIVTTLQATSGAGYPGVSVEIKVDTYPNHKFKGKIDSIQRSSGAKSSLFPPDRKSTRLNSSHQII